MNQPQRVKVLDAIFNAREEMTVFPLRFPHVSKCSLFESARVDFFHQGMRVFLKAKSRDCAVRNLATEVGSNVRMWV